MFLVDEEVFLDAFENHVDHREFCNDFNKLLNSFKSDILFNHECSSVFKSVPLGQFVNVLLPLVIIMRIQIRNLTLLGLSMQISSTFIPHKVCKFHNADILLNMIDRMGCSILNILS